MFLSNEIHIFHIHINIHTLIHVHHILPLFIFGMFTKMLINLRLWCGTTVGWPYFDTWIWTVNRSILRVMCKWSVRTGGWVMQSEATLEEPPTWLFLQVRRKLICNQGISFVEDHVVSTLAWFPSHLQIKVVLIRRRVLTGRMGRVHLFQNIL